MTLRDLDLGNNHSTRNSCRDTLPCTTCHYLVLLPADGEASWSLFPSLVSLLSGGTCKQKTPIPVSSRWQVSSEKAKKDKYQH